MKFFAYEVGRLVEIVGVARGMGEANARCESSFQHPAGLCVVGELDGCVFLAMKSDEGISWSRAKALEKVKQ